MILKKLTRRTFALIIFVTGTLLNFATIISPVGIISEINQKEADNRVKALKNAETTEDSISILIDVYDLSDTVNKEEVGMQILDLSQRSDNKKFISSIINEMAASAEDPQALQRLMEICESMPDNEEKKTVETVLQMEKAKADAALSKGRDLQTKILDSSLIGMVVGGDPYLEIQNIFRALSFLGTSSQGPMYFEYIKRLEDLVNELPDKDHAIKILYYATAANFYTRKRDYSMAIKNDRLLVKELQKMENESKSEGRSNIGFDYLFYISNRRILRNFRGLKPEEIEEIYATLNELAENNEEVREAFGDRSLAKSYYFIATEQFDKALPELKKSLQIPDISDFSRQELLGLLARAQNETGDPMGELESLRSYIKLSLVERAKRFQDTAREVELRNNINKILAKQRLEEDERTARRNSMRKVSITLVYVLGIILIFMIGAYVRLKAKVTELEKNNKRLHRDFEHIFDDGMPRGTSDLRYIKNRLKG